MPFRVETDPLDEIIERIRRGELTHVPFAQLAGSDYEIPQTLGLRWVPEGGEPGWLITFRVGEDGVPRCIAFRMDMTEGGREIRSGDLKLSVEDCLDMAARSLAARRFIDGGTSKPVPGAYAEAKSGGNLRAVRAARQPAKQKITDDMLRKVAEIYRANLNTAPTEAVAIHYGVVGRTARLYVSRARKAGHLGAAVRGKAGEV